MADVDQSAWKYRLVKYCRVKLGGEGDSKFERDIPADFYLVLDQDEDWRTNHEDHMGFDLVLFCGVYHRTNPSKEYVNTLAKIAALGSMVRPNEPGVES